MGDFVQNTILPAFMKFVNTKAIRAIKDGMMFSMPLIITGAVFLLLNNIPEEHAAAFIASLGIGPFLSHGYQSTFAITAVITAIGVGYTWAKNDGFEPLSAGVISLAVFLILIPEYVSMPNLFDASGNLIYGTVTDPETGEVVSQALGTLFNSSDTATYAEVTSLTGLNYTWLGGQGMIGALISGLISGLIYSKFLEKDIRIRMPEGVPDGVAAAFTGLIPAAVICTGAVIVYGLCMGFVGVTPIELIYKFVQTPLQNLGGSLPGYLTFQFLIPLFWFFGVHGATVVGSVSSPIAQANQLKNFEIYQTLLAANNGNAEIARSQMADHGAYIYTEAFGNCFQAPTGSGWTLGLVIFMVFFAKSAQMKQVGKLGLGCGIFNINEPVLFGTPIVLNPKMIVPFVATPVIINAVAFILTDIGFMPYTIGVTVPWTTPPILSGLICIGWQAALVQLAGIVASFFIYLPFAKSLDDEYLALEQGEA